MLHSRFVVIDLSAGPCTYGKIETEEGSVSSRTLPRLRNIMFPKGFSAANDLASHDVFDGQLASLIATTVEHVIAPDIRYMRPNLFCMFPSFYLHNMDIPRIRFSCVLDSYF